MDSAGHHLFRRCLDCPNTTPACPPCAKDETCTLSSRSCTVCASTSCVKNTSNTTDKHSTPAGAIAGGVIGGIVVIALITYLVWRFLIRDRRKEWDEQVWTDEVVDGVEKRDQTGLHPSARQSTRSVHSIASTVLTRASNVIQIAYIPGVTNRSPPDTPGLLVPPVPPLPLATVNSSASSPSYTQDQHFFLPGDIRDSTFSGYSDMTRSSISPSMARASVATTIYQNNAIVSPLPAQQALRAKAAMVSVKSGSTTPSDQISPRIPSPPMPGSGKSFANSKSPIVARNLVARPIQVKKTPSGTTVPTLANLKAKAAVSNKSSTPEPKTDASLSTASSSLLDDSSSEEEDNSESAQRGLMTRPGHRFDAVTAIENSPAVRQGDSSDGSSSSVSPHPPARSSNRDSSAGATHRHKKSGSLQSIIEEAMNRAARDPSHGGLGSISESSSRKREGPFSDENEVKENI